MGLRNGRAQGFFFQFTTVKANNRTGWLALVPVLLETGYLAHLIHGARRRHHVLVQQPMW
jgi:hypothetical protein